MQYYQAALKAFNKETIKRNLDISGLAGIFILIMLLSTGSRNNQEKALQILQNQLKADSENIFKHTLNQLDETLEIQLGKSTLEMSYYLKGCGLNIMYPLSPIK